MLTQQLYTCFGDTKDTIASSRNTPSKWRQNAHTTGFQSHGHCTSLESLQLSVSAISTQQTNTSSDGLCHSINSLDRAHILVHNHRRLTFTIGYLQILHNKCQQLQNVSAQHACSLIIEHVVSYSWQ